MIVLYPLYAPAANGNNRNILECKLFFLTFFAHHDIEIIETYWNVNAIAPDGNIKIGESK